MTCFNPRPAFWPGATFSRESEPSSRSCFNPRPAFWPGATLRRGETGASVSVSILARPFGRAYIITYPTQASWTVGFNPRPAFWPGATFLFRRMGQSRSVSILARPFGRALRPRRAQPGQGSRFQSSPGLLAGRVQGPISRGRFDSQFQSSPGLLAGRYEQAASSEVVNQEVSILARPFGRARTWLRPRLCWRAGVSILARPFGRALRVGHSPPGWARHCFNPRPAFWPGATVPWPATRPSSRSFNPRPAFWPGVQPFWDSSIAFMLFQSSPGLLAGR